ncbi:MAG: homoserine dehydrogenase [Proteobacteria bacterium]|nr:homoserine dehydrogenase [Pseudomonadota bacterium]
MKKLRIGIAGLGTVGQGVYEILKKDAKIIADRSQTNFEIVAVTSRTKKDFVDPKIKFYTNTLDLAKDAEVDVIVEVIGGTEIAKDLIELAIKNGKKVVTANKALLAEYGAEISELAEKHNSHIGFEASTAGANPVIKTFKESFTGSEITELYAILNGTCNFILSKMSSEGSDYLETLKEAQKLGYAEADPTLDVKGIDTAHKLVILSSIASATKPAFKKLHIEGVDQVSINDIKLADDLGYKIKLLAIYKNLGDSIQQTVYPALIKKTEKIAQVDGPFNAVLINTTNASWNISIGRGAGGLTTGSAIIADLIDIARGNSTYLFGVENSKLSTANLIDISKRQGKYFLHLVIDKSLAQKGDLAAKIFADKIKITQATFIDKDSEIICGFLTETLSESDVKQVLENLDSDLVKSEKFLRVEETGF